MAILIESRSDQQPAKRQPKYARMADEFRAQVRSGVLSPGDQLPSFASMQAEFGIGQATLERTYAILEEERLIVRQHGRGIFVAEPQAQPAQRTVAIIADSKLLQHPYYIHLLRGAQREVEQAGVEMMLLHANSTLSWDKVSGLIVVTGATPARPIPPGVPQVELMNSLSGAAAVIADDYDGARQATEYLLSLGHRRIAFMTQGRLPAPGRSPARDRLSSDRLRAYSDVLQAAGIPPLASWVRNVRQHWEPVGPWAELGRNQMERWLAEDWDELGCTAILTQNDETAVGVVEALQAAGRRVPEDISVVGFDGYETADFFRPRLTTVQVPLEAIGARGARLLLERIEGMEAGSPVASPATIALPTTLRIGDSTAPVREVDRIPTASVSKRKRGT